MANDPRFEVYPRQYADTDLGAATTVDSVEGEGIGHPDDEPTGPPTGDFGWRFRAANGQISAIGGEGFTRRMDAHRAVRQFLTAVAEVILDNEAPVLQAPILDVDE